MPVGFLSEEQRRAYGRYAGEPSAAELARFFHLDDADHALIAGCRGDHNRLGFALQLCTARFLGTFLEDVREAPEGVVSHLARQIGVFPLAADLAAYAASERRWDHRAEICRRGGYRELADAAGARFALARWLYALCWTGTERPGALFRAGGGVAARPPGAAAGCHGPGAAGGPRAPARG